MNYGIKCKQTKNDLKSAFAAQDREQSQKKKLEQLRQKSPGDRNKLSIAETDLQKASVEASRISKALQEQMDKFEMEKLRDIKVGFFSIFSMRYFITITQFKNSPKSTSYEVLKEFKKEN